MKALLLLTAGFGIVCWTVARSLDRALDDIGSDVKPGPRVETRKVSIVNISSVELAASYGGWPQWDTGGSLN